MVLWVELIFILRLSPTLVSALSSYAITQWIKHLAAHSEIADYSLNANYFHSHYVVMSRGRAQKTCMTIFLCTWRSAYGWNYSSGFQCDATYSSLPHWVFKIIHLLIPHVMRSSSSAFQPVKLMCFLRLQDQKQSLILCVCVCLCSRFWHWAALLPFVSAAQAWD